jgi:hypothetical protein
MAGIRPPMTLSDCEERQLQPLTKLPWYAKHREIGPIDELSRFQIGFRCRG